MSTLSELINEVCDDLMRDDITSQVSDSVVLAIRHYDNRRWWFSEGTATFTCSAGVTEYSLPSDFKEMDYVEVTLPGDNAQEVKPRPFSCILGMNQGNSVTGYPQAYAIYNEKIHLAYPPNSASALVITQYYVKKQTDLSADGSNSWTTDGRELIRARAARMTSLRSLHDRELAASFETIEAEALANLQAENDRRTVGSQYIKAHY